MEIQRVTLSDWENLLPATGYEVFHTPAALEVLDEHTTGELQLFGGFKGESPVALLPVFVREGSVGRGILSPPPEMGVPRLGPLVMPNSPKPSKRESITRRFVDGVLEELAVSGPLTVVRLRCGLSFGDPRPFAWQDFDVEPAFTYLLDVDQPDLDAVLSSFSKSHRREFRRAAETDLTVSREGPAAAERIIEHVGDRYDEFDSLGQVDWPYVRDLLAALPERSQVYVARDPDGSYRSGIVTLEADGRTHFWQGGVRESYTTEDGGSVSVNALLHRAVIRDAVEDPDLERYDLVGGNTRRLSEYKAKFGGELSPYYIVESTGVSTAIAKAGYQFLARHR
jgi:hypothetical protein